MHSNPQKGSQIDASRLRLGARALMQKVTGVADCSHPVKGFDTFDRLLPICCTAAKASMDRPCLPAIHFLLLPGVDTANFLGDLLRHFSLDEHNVRNIDICNRMLFVESQKQTKSPLVGIWNVRLRLTVPWKLIKHILRSCCTLF